MNQKEKERWVSVSIASLLYKKGSDGGPGGTDCSIGSLLVGYGLAVVPSLLLDGQAVEE